MISIIKLSNGETLLAEVTHKDSSKMTVLNPLKVDIIQHFGGPAMITTFWVPFEKEKISVDISTQHVIMSTQVPKQTVDFYNKSLQNVRGDVTEEVREEMRKVMKKVLTSNNSYTVH